MAQRTNRDGSIANYVFIGVVLVVGLITAVYFLNQRGQQARKEQSIASSSTNQTTKSPSTKNTTKKIPASTSTKSTGHPGAQKLPATGPELSIMELTGIYLLTASVVAFVISRKSPAHSL